MKDLLTPSLPAIEVAVPVPVEGCFTYSLPSELQEQARPGVRVRIPFRNREMTGYIVGHREAPEGIKLKPLLAVLDAEPVLSQEILNLTRWIADYYGCSWGEAIENALPKWVKYGKKAERALQKAVDEKKSTQQAPVDLILSPEQATAFQKIKEALGKKSPKPILLHGVTGSGKSELYIRAIREVLEKGRSAICLVPEIALTEQIRRFFQAHFGSGLEILHSKLTDSERFLAWKRIEKGERRVILGPRSAVFAPLPDLGLIIMDEEHEGSYKQETVPRYHAREVALCRGAYENAVVILGSATPSLEAMYKAGKDELEYVRLANRIDEKALPPVQMVDLKEAAFQQKKAVILTSRLAQEIETNLRKKEGTMLLLNRRGFSTRIQCPQCGVAEVCESCQVSLTFHQEEDILLCHYCNFRKPVSALCPSCKAPVLKFAGFGTEKVESEVAMRFPQARIARMDADTVKKRGSHEEILKSFREREVDILIGTQMIAKGFDFPHVTLVGVILADVGLMLPDFRSAERTFQLMTQVAGRAGRGNLPGRVIIQTFSPDHPSIRFSRTHDYQSFFDYESKVRQEYRYPPFQRLINIIIRGREEKKTYVFARELRDAVRQNLATEPGVEILGPAPLPFYKLRGHYRWHVMLKAPLADGLETSLIQKLRASLLGLKKASGVQYALDVDPLSVL